MEFDNFLDERKIYVLLFNSRNVIHNCFFRLVTLLCCGRHFNNINSLMLRPNTEVLSLGRFLSLLTEPYNVHIPSIGHVPWS